MYDSHGLSEANRMQMSVYMGSLYWSDDDLRMPPLGVNKGGGYDHWCVFDWSLRFLPQMSESIKHKITFSIRSVAHKKKK